MKRWTSSCSLTPILVERLYLWTPASYTLVNPPSLWVLVGCFLMWRFGEELERHLGRRSFVWLVGGLLVVAPLIITLLGLLGMTGKGLMGLHHLQFGIFVAFAALYPRAQISLLIINIEAWVLAAIFVGVAALGDLAQRDWTGLICLAGEVALAVGFVRYEQGQLNWTTFRPTLPKPKIARRPLQTSAVPKSRAPAIKRGPEVDDILDKISRDGMHSLTEEERNVLARASDDLQKRKR